MTDRTKLGIIILIVSLLLGSLGDALLRATPWGLNIFVWTVGLVASVIFIIRWRRVALDGSGMWLVVPVLFFAAAMAWRDSPVLGVLNLLALGLSLTFALLRAQSGRLLLAGVLEYALGVAIATLNATGGAGRLLFGDIHWAEIPHNGLMRHSLPVGRGLAIAFPLLLVFGGLLAAADAVFSNFIARAGDWDIASFIGHIFISICIAWMVAGYLRGMLLGKEIAITARQRPQSLYLGITELVIALGLLDVLFLSFVVVQFRYFFGGAARVQGIAGLSYSDYARSGFFELVAVAVLVLPLLLIADWLLRKDNRLHEHIFRVLAGVQVALLFVIMISALQRMRLYQREYGLTELRLYTTVFMGWLAIVLGWFALTALRGRRELFAFGAATAGFFMIVGLQFINPDRLIVCANVEHALAGRRFDAGYAVSLSADAVPEIIDSLPKLDQPKRCELAIRLMQQKADLQHLGWRRWNWSRAEAKRELDGYDKTLRAMSCPQALAIGESSAPMWITPMIGLGFGKREVSIGIQSLSVSIDKNTADLKARFVELDYRINSSLQNMITLAQLKDHASMHANRQKPTKCSYDK